MSKVAMTFRTIPTLNKFSEEFYMSENVYWFLEFSVNPGRFEDLKTLNAELVEGTRKNVPGMLDNHWAGSTGLPHL